MLIQRALAILTGIWLGAQLIVGYVVAPILFQHLPKMTAGNLAGELFTLLSYFGLAVWFGFVAFLSHRIQATAVRVLLAVLCLLIAANQWLITPVIEALKTQGQNWLLSWLGGNFGMWHGISAVVYLLVSLIGGYLVCRFLRLKMH
ncbi:DUF4149 domain-containing protein [Stenoxybacter acetivorans]|uniref:DUF4149 domain-containing protein n=1 Tax=Stenoxybacter acetivorans TaxID=422441 RepID=UPI000565373D|nr:DUF4149 domain-containing protein [Stenoxybacter acetivorans]